MSIESMPKPEAESRDPVAYHGLESLREATRGNEYWEDLYDMIEGGVHDYYERTLRYRSINRDTPNKHVEQIDQAKRITHNALLSNLEALARNLKAEGKPTPWWDGPGGFFKGTAVNRYLVADWAIKEASKYLQQELKTRENV